MHNFIYRNSDSISISISVSKSIVINNGNQFYLSDGYSIEPINKIEMIDRNRFQIYVRGFDQREYLSITINPVTSEVEHILRFIIVYQYYMRHFVRESGYSSRQEYFDLSLLYRCGHLLLDGCHKIQTNNIIRFEVLFRRIMESIKISPSERTPIPSVEELQQMVNAVSPFNFTTAPLPPSSSFYASSATQSSVRIIHTHDYKPKFVKHPDSTSLLLGAEIEIDKGGRDNAEVAKHCCSIMNTDENTEDYIYCMHDGSLPDGFEMATMPCGLDVHKELPYKEMFDYLVEQGYRAHNTSTCGLHVHVNRSFFGETNLQRQIGIGNLIYLVENFGEQIEKIARRGYNRYYHKIGVTKEDTTISAYAKGNANPSKYASVNTQHKDTIELRMFKGTLNYNTFISTLEFVKVICTVAKETSIYDIESVVWEDLYNQFSDQLKDYYNLRVSKEAANEPSNNNCNTDEYEFSSLQQYAMIQPSEETIPTTDEEFRREIKKLRKNLRQAERSNNTFAIRQCSQNLQDMQRRYNEYRHANRQTFDYL